MESVIIPSAIQRIRSFLIERSGMKVKPWASAEETLAALHATLVARHECGIFWTSLRGLLEALARDFKARQEAQPGVVVDNELLDGDRYSILIDEIRAVLVQQAGESSSFRRLASALSAPALALLLLLGGVATVGCSEHALRAPSDAAGPQSASDAIRDLGSAAEDRVSTCIICVEGGIAPGPVVRKDAAPDLASREARPDIEPSDSAAVTIREILQACNMSEGAQDGLLACLATLRASWTTGVAESLVDQDCDAMAQELSCFAQSNCTGAPTSKEFDIRNAFVCPPRLVYVGVRFV